MVLNGVNFEGGEMSLVLDAFEPFTNKSLKERIKEIVDDYNRKFTACLENGGDKAMCSNEASQLTSISMCEFLRDAFFIRQSLDYKTRYENKKEFKTWQYAEKQPTAIMIHSPASAYLGNGHSIHNDWSHFNSQKKVNKSTHFLVDGKTGYIYCVFPLRWLANHCASSKHATGMLKQDKNGNMLLDKDGNPIWINNPEVINWKTSYNNTALAIDICEPIEIHATDKEEPKNKGVVKKEGNTWYWIESSDMIKASRNTVAIDAAAELAAMLCCLYDLNPLGQAPAVVHRNYDGKWMNIPENGIETEMHYNVVLGHGEGYKWFNKAYYHGDPVNIWSLLKNKYYESDDAGLNQFRYRVNERTEYYKIHRNEIHPILELLYLQGQSDTKLPKPQ